jgi:hypothetical protein
MLIQVDVSKPKRRFGGHDTEKEKVLMRIQGYNRAKEHVVEVVKRKKSVNKHLGSATICKQGDRSRIDQILPTPM